MPTRLLTILLLAIFGVAQARADTLDDIRHRGHLTCAVSLDTDDQSLFDGHGDLSRFETDYCRAISAAILGDPARATIDAEDDESAGLRDLRAGHADIMIGSTPDPALALAMHLRFTPPILIDGQGFLVDPKLGIRSLADIKTARVCFIGNTPAANMITDRMAELGARFSPFEFSERGEMMSAVATNHCNLMTGDITELANERLALPATEHFEILPQLITTDPLSPFVRNGDERLAAIVTAVDAGLLQATVHGVTRADAASLAKTATNPIIRRIVGSDGWIGPSLGLDDRWLLRAVEAVGNQAEIYGRDVGSGSKLHLPVGPNAPLESGGALLATPVEIAR